MLWKIVIISFFFMWVDRNVCVAGDASRKASTFHTKCLPCFTDYNQKFERARCFPLHLLSMKFRGDTHWIPELFHAYGLKGEWTEGWTDTAIVISIPQRWECTSRSCTIRRYKNNLTLHYCLCTLMPWIFARVK